VHGHAAADLTRQLLAYAGKGRFVTERIDLSELVFDILALIQSSIPKTALDQAPPRYGPRPEPRLAGIFRSMGAILIDRVRRRLEQVLVPLAGFDSSTGAGTRHSSVSAPPLRGSTSTTRSPDVAGHQKA
jgi:hypothetical protein